MGGFSYTVYVNAYMHILFEVIALSLRSMTIEDAA